MQMDKLDLWIIETPQSSKRKAEKAVAETEVQLKALQQALSMNLHRIIPRKGPWKMKAIVGLETTNDPGNQGEMEGDEEVTEVTIEAIGIHMMEAIGLNKSTSPHGMTNHYNRGPHPL
jgi:hypothetical protein